ncbi:ABC transporter permease [Lichenihabitans sp. Uapishka_5]|uniref:ABC transporter permease n=1 Tax=Lichenihabitans sp. Uapishka_5 TaxID=3037302 RepID=UPI0029E7ECDB|nr:ABC transporter permease [Lichenihabitans sp. Uapishka_5]MDX7949589.1 ABC transporter permease [Lichenihabitans sp. Uapishka_5]
MSIDVVRARRSSSPAWRGLDPVGTLLAALAVAALLAEPFVTLRPNRIASGKGLALWASLPPVGAVAALLAFAVLAVMAARRGAPLVQIMVGGLGLALLIGVVGEAPRQLVLPGNAFARVSPAGGFWIALLAFALLATDGAAKLRPGPLARLAALTMTLGAGGAVLASGWLDGLSPLHEYASHANTFWGELAKHVELSLGSLMAAVLAGLPLGVACVRVPRLRAAVLPVLNIVQTIPSIAMYGLMMVPLGLLAAEVPLLADLGIRGIGTAPAAIALFLYALLPVVASTATGLDQVPAAARDAARGMGMTSGQRLRSVELPLATPAILTGIRVVLVQNIGLVTVAALIGGGGLGTFVFQGIGQSATDLVLLGAIPIIVLAFTAAVLLDATVDLTRKAAP